MSQRPAPAPARIVALLPFLVQGALSLGILRALRALGTEVAVAYCLPEAVGYTRDPAEDFAAEGRLIDLTALGPDAALRHLAEEFAARDTRLAVQIGAFPLYPLLPALKQRRPGLHTVDTLYNEVGHTVNHFLYENSFDGVIVESHAMRRFVERCTEKPDPGVAVVESGIDLTRYAPNLAAAADGPLRIAYIGRMSPEKNPLGFVELAEALAPRLPGARFAMHGEGPDAATVRDRVSASPLGEHLIYHGRADDIAVTLRGIDVLVVPSHLDGRPTVVMEANATGVPVIGAPVGGIPELIEDGRNGLLAAPREIDRIAETLAAWAAEPDGRARRGAVCRRIAETRFDRTRMIADYAAAFDRFLAA